MRKSCEIYTDIKNIDVKEMRMTCALKLLGGVRMRVENVEESWHNLTWELFSKFMEYLGMNLRKNKTRVTFIFKDGKTLEMNKGDHSIMIPWEDLEQYGIPHEDSEKEKYFRMATINKTIFELTNPDDPIKIQIEGKFDVYGPDGCPVIRIIHGFEPGVEMKIKRVERYPDDEIRKFMIQREPEENPVWNDIVKFFYRLDYLDHMNGNVLTIKNYKGFGVRLMKFGHGVIDLFNCKITLKQKEQGIYRSYDKYRSIEDWYFEYIEELRTCLNSNGEVNVNKNDYLEMRSVTKIQIIKILSDPKIIRDGRISLWIAEDDQGRDPTDFKSVGEVKLEQIDDIGVGGYALD